ncbi:CcmD family protein [Neobacillus pocheonensis]|uniref:CcmD family protein n=1 Tax=Neobacillus pocheonensis TaxID=363869 RepID=A0ABT0W5S5_9BACI|nr:CcmD family protein [Neobacillus pocheonensis]
MGYIYGAYSVAWLVIFGYLVMMGKRHSKLKKEIEFLKQLDK